MRTVLSVLAAFGAALGVAWGHGGASSWIQGLNYLVAAFPLAMAMISLARARREHDRRARRLYVYYFAMAAAIAVYAWSDVERHRRELVERERAVESGDLTGIERNGQTLWFRHSISRKHVWDRGTGQWRDEDVGG